MCAIIGAVLQTPSESDFKTIKNVFVESKIRGMHATGLSYIQHGKIVTVKEAVSADKFKLLDNIQSLVNEDGNLYLIGHCRYSTSDLQFNQPISNDSVSIAHNGIITQEPPERWEEMFGYKCIGKNDSELILQSLKDKSPLELWKDSSLAVCELYLDKKIRFYRNGKRPIYYTSVKNGYIITSTKNIAIRSNIKGDTIETYNNTYYKINQFKNISHEVIDIDNMELQFIL